MRISIFVLCLLSLSPQFSESVCPHCGDWDDDCYELCLFEYSESKEIPCALIRVCQRQPQHVKCQNVPNMVPDRCQLPPKPHDPPYPQPPKPHGPAPPHPNSPTNECKCLNKTLEGPGGLPIGHCLTKDPENDKLFCYVDANNGCSDTKQSRRLPNLFYSYEACENE